MSGMRADMHKSQRFPQRHLCVGGTPRIPRPTCPMAKGQSRDKESFSYAVYWNACKRLTQGTSATEKTDLFSGTAARFYRLTLPRGA